MMRRDTRILGFGILALLAIAAALLLGGCATPAPRGATYAPVDTQSIIAPVIEGQAAVKSVRDRVRAAKVIPAPAAGPGTAPEDMISLPLQQEVEKKLSDAEEKFTLAGTRELEQRAKAKETADTLNATVKQRDNLVSDLQAQKLKTAAAKTEIAEWRRKYHDECGFFARLKSNVTIFCAGLVLGIAAIFLIRLAGGFAAILARIGLKASTGV